MEKKLISLETQMALVQQELISLRGSKQDMPQWLKNAAITMLGAIFLQTIAAVWWASEITSQQQTIKEDVKTNTQFRSEYPKTQQMIMIKLTEIQSENKHMKGMLHEVKDKLRYLDTPNPQ